MSTKDSSLMFYLQNINTIPLLSKEEEKEVARKVRSGDKEAQSRLVTANLRFVVKIAKRYANKGIPIVDLISEGNLGLIRATETFEPERGFHFISYAVHWIKQSIIKYIAEKSKPVRMPLSWNNNFIKISKFRDEGLHATSGKNKMEAMAQELKMKKNEIIRLLQFSQSNLSLEQEIYSSKNDNALQMKHTIENENSVNPEEELLHKHIEQKIKEHLHQLKPIEQDIIKSRFCLYKSRTPQTLLEIGKRYCLTKE